ncbi:D-glycero-beta-D-manno-heptose 1,7-bisphosphate 7-phosphatase [Rhizobacter sp. Root1221]|jgi:D-glycero-D-manno-heptose 1,7-bisphosphate phosphatase|uniref:D-glycero-beta-D-manno-heptose 1,7-bisphosphate 7-phosphatase n=1 Tax=Rhizobacter sp. Root1221 TaxID=1736433 RepID=UPI0006FA5FA1|nr:D-glycero-beta-D-manno-heptose 1,7-bisphosphate 7-phosphatase [Rhizobacter sp. Root1221]KQV91705.1 histidinol phosphate phosphatase [Rhizobacter sp. Root1221]
MNLIILDRDGTINEDRDDYVKSADDWLPIPGSLEAIARLNHAGWHTVIASNQSGLGRGLFDMASLNAMHAKMNALLAKVGGRIDAVFFCPHTPDETCECRKPLPGLFRQIGERYGVDLSTVPVVGDSLRDLQAGVALGCKPHLVRTGKGAATEPGVSQLVPGTVVHDDLAAFAEHMIQQERLVRGNAGLGEASLGRLD